jgi:hypothetical protein
LRNPASSNTNEEFSLERHYCFIGGPQGPWRVSRMASVRGEPLPEVTHLTIQPGLADAPAGAGWCLRGAVSNERYVTRPEREALAQRQEGLGRGASVRAVLIPIRKSAAWWALAQDERRKIIEEDSQHIAIGMEYLPAVARRLHHCRDLPTAEPFDFLTWFEFAAGDEASFDSLLERLRATREWAYVERECELRLARAS